MAMKSAITSRNNYTYKEEEQISRQMRIFLQLGDVAPRDTPMNLNCTPPVTADTINHSLVQPPLSKKRRVRTKKHRQISTALERWGSTVNIKKAR